MDRAQRHDPNGYEKGVLWSNLVEHLGFAREPVTTFKLRPQVSRLRAAGVVERGKMRGLTVWKLTSDGRKQLTRARRTGENLRLPEAPQHRLWREARATSSERIVGLRAQLSDTLREASELIASEDGGDSDAWFALRGRLGKQIERLAGATYCLREWAEPDDARADVEDASLPQGDHRRNFYWATDQK
jgi:hypothetical protein